MTFGRMVLIGFMVSMPAGFPASPASDVGPASVDIPGECKGGCKGTCQDHDPCTDDFCGCSCDFGGCFPVCQSLPASGSACDDGNLCTTGDLCSNGACVGTLVTCDDGDRCTSDACDPQSGSCMHTAIGCDDGSSCTADACDHLTGCVHTGTPAEVASLLFSDPVTLEWLPAVGAELHNTYRGTISPLGFNRRDPVYDHGCFESADAQVNGGTLSRDAEDPPAGTGFYYLVDGESSFCGEGPLGMASDGTLPTPAAPCPTPP